jgi:uncharacterized membrane protein YdjX (TVP38/TMEM64 family)
MNESPREDSPPLPASPSRPVWIRWSILAVLVSGVAGFYVFGLQEYLSWDALRANAGTLQSRVDDNLFLALFLFFALYAVLAGFSVPAAWILTLVAGALFGRFLGAAVALLAATVGATLAFWTSRFLLHDWVQARFGSRLEAFNRGLEKDGAFYLFSLRLAPIFPFFLINLAMGLTPMRAATFFWVSLIGMAPGSFLYANAGSELATLRLSWTLMASLALLGIAPLAIRKLLQWRQKLSKY